MLSPLLVRELNLLVKFCFGIGGQKSGQTLHFIMTLPHLPDCCQPAIIYIRPAGFLGLLGFLQLIQSQYSPNFHTFQM